MNAVLFQNRVFAAVTKFQLGHEHSPVAGRSVSTYEVGREWGVGKEGHEGGGWDWTEVSVLIRKHQGLPTVLEAKTAEHILLV